MQNSLRKIIFSYFVNEINSSYNFQIGKTKYGTKYGPHKTLGREKTGGKY